MYLYNVVEFVRRYVSLTESQESSTSKLRAVNSGSPVAWATLAASSLLRFCADPARIMQLADAKQMIMHIYTRLGSGSPFSTMSYSVWQTTSRLASTENCGC